MRGPRRPDVAAVAHVNAVSPEQGLRWAALLYALTSLALAVLLFLRADGDAVAIAQAVLVAVQGWAVLGLLSLFADLVGIAFEIREALVEPEDE